MTAALLAAGRYEALRVAASDLLDVTGGPAAQIEKPGRAFVRRWRKFADAELRRRVERLGAALERGRWSAAELQADRIRRLAAERELRASFAAAVIGRRRFQSTQRADKND